MPLVDDLPPPPSRSSGIDDLPPPAAREPGLFDGSVKSTIDALPAIGGVVGGALGTPFDVVSGPAGTVVGAGIGGFLEHLPRTS